MKIKTTYSTKKDFQKLRENGFKFNVGDKIKLSAYQEKKVYIRRLSATRKAQH